MEIKVSRHFRLNVLICLALIGCDDKSAPLAPGYEVPDAQRRDATSIADTGVMSDSTVATDATIPTDAMQRTDAVTVSLDGEVAEPLDAGESLDTSSGGYGNYRTRHRRGHGWRDR